MALKMDYVVFESDVPLHAGGWLLDLLLHESSLAFVWLFTEVQDMLKDNPTAVNEDSYWGHNRLGNK